MEALDRLAQWYSAQCDGDWEHEFGIELGTLDNPGWSLSIDLSETGLEGVPFAEVSDLESASEWITCKVVGQKFEGRCGAKVLKRMIVIFLQWAERSSRPRLPR
jgi:hypothetical protein